MVLYQIRFRSYFHWYCSTLLHNTPVALVAVLDYHSLMTSLAARWEDERSLDIDIHRNSYSGGSLLIRCNFYDDRSCRNCCSCRSSCCWWKCCVCYCSYCPPAFGCCCILLDNNHIVHPRIHVSDYILYHFWWSLFDDVFGVIKALVLIMWLWVRGVFLVVITTLFLIIRHHWSCIAGVSWPLVVVVVASVTLGIVFGIIKSNGMR